MDVVIEGERITLSDQDLLGQGGEGRVYRRGRRAVKIFHAPPPAKIGKLVDFPRGLPSGVVAPIHLARDPRGGDVVGYTMQLVEKATDALRLGQRRFRHGAITNAAVCALLRRLHEIVTQVHARGVVVGDLNDGNVVFTGTTPWLIDTDSMQFGAHACTVAHERFLDPRLFGVDLTGAPRFDPASDWYAFAVLAFTSLLYVHPYGGQHKTIPTLLRRAEARHSILRSDVAYPRAAAPLATLPDDLLHAFVRLFDRGERGVFPDALLSQRWTTCSCGVEHARASCPSCAARAQVPAVVRAGGVRAVRVFATRGRILAVAWQGGLRYAYEDDAGVIRREDGARVPVTASANARIALAGAVTWVHDAGVLRKVAGERVVAELEASAFGASPAGCFYVAGDWLLDAETGARVGQVLGPTTWLEMGPRFGVGFYRAGRITVHFVVRPGRGVKRVALPTVDGRLIDATATFDDDRALVAIASEKDGRRTHALYLVREDGEVLARAHGAPESRPLLASVFGKCLASGALLSATDDGLLLARPDPASGDLVEQKTFADTRDFVATGADILAGPRGSVYLVQSGEVVHLTT